AVVAAPAGVEVVAVAGQAVDRAVGRGAGGHADRRGRVGVAPGRDHAAGGDVDALAGDDRIGGDRAAAQQRQRQRGVVGSLGGNGGGQGEGGGEGAGEQLGCHVTCSLGGNADDGRHDR